MLDDPGLIAEFVIESKEHLCDVEARQRNQRRAAEHTGDEAGGEAEHMKHREHGQHAILTRRGASPHGQLQRVGCS